MRHPPSLRGYDLSLVVGGIEPTLLLLHWRSDLTAHVSTFYWQCHRRLARAFVTVVATKFWFKKVCRHGPAVRGNGMHLWHRPSLTGVLVLMWGGYGGV
jgi:hypothetical protein